MPATDNFSSNATGLDSPGNDAEPITPNDGADLTEMTRALIVGIAGDLHVITRRGNERTLVNVPAGVLPLRVSKVFATGTTATNLSAIY